MLPQKLPPGVNPSPPESAAESFSSSSFSSSFSSSTSSKLNRIDEMKTGVKRKLNNAIDGLFSFMEKTSPETTPTMHSQTPDHGEECVCHICTVRSVTELIFNPYSAHMEDLLQNPAELIDLCDSDSEAPKDAARKNFCCNHCEAVFIKQEDLDKHLLNQHSNNKLKKQIKQE